MIGNTIFEIRKQKGLTLSELAKRAKISKSYLSNIERNLNRNPSIEVVKRIAEVLDIEFDAFLSKKNKDIQLEIDQDLIDFVAELKETGIGKEQIKEFKTLIEFIKWKNLKSSEDINRGTKNDAH
ncbi:transcriptional regulator with XRE-family HTH domain [Neobacillus bataviensis]|uniref:Transcriptional regulator with XRE-family HTH domain n=1 Tax=Neobacillus bataviensis TaxID=220685 RepID=A0A561D652_9BACI|nr:helix-turn-helix domain-containing protein [Neobacillus bataviensis]TWD98913.1 transcriptional regulator with XRE-family HTH domain [Neobacillus bataviensis]